MKNETHQVEKCSKTVRLYPIAIVAVLLLSCSQQEQEQILHGKTMGTTWMVKYVGKPVIQKQVLENYLKRFNQIMSTYIDDSEISIINRAPIGQWLTISADLTEIIRLSLTISQQTQGAFDITVGKAVNYWGFGNKKEAIAPKKQEIGYQYLRLDDDNHRLYKEKNILIDLSAIAKGHAVDKLAKLLQNAQIDRYLIEIGGEIIARGTNKKGKLWKIAIEKPDPLQRQIMYTIELNNQAIASSGSYRNFKQQEGRIISHTINPKTSAPITHHVIASSVIADSAAHADAYATAFMVLPVASSMIISDKRRLATLIITGKIGDNSTFHSHQSKRFEQQFSIR